MEALLIRNSGQRSHTIYELTRLSQLARQFKVNINVPDAYGIFQKIIKRASLGSSLEVNTEVYLRVALLIQARLEGKEVLIGELADTYSTRAELLRALVKAKKILSGYADTPRVPKFNMEKWRDRLAFVLEDERVKQISLTGYENHIDVYISALDLGLEADKKQRIYSISGIGCERNLRAVREV